MFVSDRASDISKCFVSRQLPAALDRYLTALPAMSLGPGHSILLGPALLLRFAQAAGALLGRAKPTLREFRFHRRDCISFSKISARVESEM